jgi:hypothetical protein
VIVSALGLKGCESGGMADALDSGSSGLCACGGSSPPFRTRFLYLVLVVVLGGSGLIAGCRSEGERYIDEMADTLHEAARIMKSEENPQRASEKTLAYLQEHAVRMRIIQSRLDDTIRTLNPGQRKILADYAVRKLAPVRAMVEE